MAARDYVTIGLRSKSYAIRVVNDWIKLPEEKVELGSLGDFKGRLDNVWLAVLGNDSVLILGLRRWSTGKHIIGCFSPCRS